MPALNFKKQFAAAVINGTKSQTIRANRKHPIKIGDTLYLYTGMRTKNCQRLRVVICTYQCRIEINNDLARSVLLGHGSSYRFADVLTEMQIYHLAVRDGFPGTAEFREFFLKHHGSHFVGQLIEWRP